MSPIQKLLLTEHVEVNIAFEMMKKAFDFERIAKIKGFDYDNPQIDYEKKREQEYLILAEMQDSAVISIMKIVMQNPSNAENVAKNIIEALTNNNSNVLFDIYCHYLKEIEYEKRKENYPKSVYAESDDYFQTILDSVISSIIRLPKKNLLESEGSSNNVWMSYCYYMQFQPIGMYLTMYESIFEGIVERKLSKLRDFELNILDMYRCEREAGKNDDYMDYVYYAPFNNKAHALSSLKEFMMEALRSSAEGYELPYE